MTKKDTKVMLYGLAGGVTAGLLIYFLARKTQRVPEVLPTQVLWDTGS